MDWSTPGFPVHYHLPEFAQTHVHWVGDAIQPSHPLCYPPLLPSVFPSIRVFPMSWLFALGGQSTQCFLTYYYILIHISLHLGRQRIDVFEQWCWRRLLRVTSVAEIKPVNLKRNQSWICIGRTDSETEDPVLWNEQLTLWYLDPEDSPKQTFSSIKQSVLILPSPSPWQPLICLLSLLICLFWTFIINGITQCGLLCLAPFS